MDAFFNWLLATSISAGMLVALVAFASGHTSRRLRAHTDRLSREFEARIEQEKRDMDRRLAEYDARSKDWWRAIEASSEASENDPAQEMNGSVSSHDAARAS